MFFIWDYIVPVSISVDNKKKSIKKGLAIFAPPIILFTLLFFFYNFIRFHSLFEYGYNYITESPYLQQIREKTGIISLSYLSVNLWHMLLEIPALTFSDKVQLNINLKGNSILFLTPVFLAALLASPIKGKKNGYIVDTYVSVLWITAVATILPSLLIYSTGWMQFGYRYSLDITVVLLLLSLFGLKGKLNILSILAIVFSVAMHLLGIYQLT